MIHTIKCYRAKKAGFTIIEAITSVGISSVVFGLVLTAFVATQKTSDRFTEEQMLRQESLLVAQQIERVLRFRVSPSELAEGGAGQASPAAGGNLRTTPTESVSTVPISMSVAGVSTATASLTTDSLTSATAQANPKVVFENAPNSVKGMFTTGTAQQESDRGGSETDSGQQTTSTEVSRALRNPERFEWDELVVCSLSAGTGSGRIITAIKNSRVGGGNTVRPFLERGPVGHSFGPGSQLASMGSYSDKVNCQVSFRYASTFKDLQAEWLRSAKTTVPELVEYTVRVWPARLKAANFEDARDSDGRSVAFQLTSAVSIR
jgi:hypothetical protein